jgi:hypothetical protein
MRFDGTPLQNTADADRLVTEIGKGTPARTHSNGHNHKERPKSADRFEVWSDSFNRSGRRCEPSHHSTAVGLSLSSPGLTGSGGSAKVQSREHVTLRATVGA